GGQFTSVGMPWVTLRVTNLRRTACSKEDAERPERHATRSVGTIIRSQTMHATRSVARWCAPVGCATGSCTARLRAISAGACHLWNRP
ncbi:hypothetical protein CCZ00_19855, partial [Pseudomonas savastanoi pv. fraxini]